MELVAAGDDTPATHRSSTIAFAAYLGDDPGGWLPAIQSLRRVDRCNDLTVSATVSAPAAHLDVTHMAASLAQLLTDLAADEDVEWIVVAGEPCLAPAALLGQLGDFSDERIATVSFLSNAAGPLSFPFVGTEVPWNVDGGTSDDLTDRLRSFEPRPVTVPVPMAAGPVIAFSAPIVRMLPASWERGCVGWAESVAAFALAAQARGLLNVLDTTTFVQRAADLRALEPLSPAASARLLRRFPWFQTSIDVAVSDSSSPLRLEHGLARVKISGLDVLLDGSCLGPTEMGTQVGLLAIATALAERSDVGSVTITLPNVMPSYAQRLVEVPKITFVRAPIGLPIETDRIFDVAFRPFQPDESFRAPILRQRARRVIVSVLDLIAYQNGSYFADGSAWSNYRSAITGSLREVDALTTISHDVVTMVMMERLPISPDRVYPVPYGTEHVDSTAPHRMPAGFDAAPGQRFLVTLGTNYGHKNRDISIRCVAALRARGHDLKLVLVGPAVPHGSSRELESEALSDLIDGEVVMMSNVASAERNWLLAHAEAVLYPTSAEGFGLVPYEAAWLGTPTVFVPFGPLAEVAGDLPIEASDWTPESFADQVDRLLLNPALGELQVKKLREASARHTWSSTAAELCQVFRSVLSKAPIA